MDLFFFSRDFARNTFLCDGDGYLRDRRQCLIVVLERRTIPTDRKTRKEGKRRRPSEAIGKGRPAEFLFGPLPFLHRSARSPSQFHLCSPLSFPHTSARTHNSLGDIGIKYASGFQVERRKYLPHQCRLRYLLDYHIFGIMLTAMNAGRGDMAIVFVLDRRLALAAYPCPPPATAVLQKGQQ